MPLIQLLQTNHFLGTRIPSFFIVSIAEARKRQQVLEIHVHHSKNNEAAISERERYLYREYSSILENLKESLLGIYQYLY
jgi:hypothetical protein